MCDHKVINDKINAVSFIAIMNVEYGLINFDKVEEYISVQGSIGSGKSTFMKYAEEYINEYELDATNPDHTTDPNKTYVLLVDEPVDEWVKPKFDGKGILQLFYENPNKYGFPFQMVAFPSRLTRLRDRLNKVARPDLKVIVITERSPITDRLFFHTVVGMEKDMQVEWEVYKTFHDLICPNVSRKETKMIYIPTTPKVCYDRIQRRARLEEVENRVNDLYLSRLDKAHEKMVSEFTLSRGEDSVLRLDVFENDMGVEELKDVAYMTLNQVLKK